MNISVKGTKTTITPAMHELIEDKIHSLGKFLHGEHQVRVEVEVDQRHNSGDVFRVEIHVTPDDYYAEASSSDFPSALDLVVPKIREQAKKDKDKRISQRRETP